MHKIYISLKMYQEIWIFQYFSLDVVKDQEEVFEWDVSIEKRKR